jgi:SAM-dependent methyltransferase
MTARHAPATARNRDPILAVLRDILPASGLILEIASGTGEHVRHFAENMPGLDWQSTDPDPDALASIAAWSDGLANIRPPLRLDASTPDWPVVQADAILCINMVHISPWAATEGLFAGAARLLPPAAPLYLYGPYRRAGVPTAPSNEAFDASLKERNPEWGLRWLEDVVALATRTGFIFDRLVEMPANNVSLVFRREGAS